MQLFQLIRNPQFFSLLSSPNREIYVEALFVVFRCYKQELLIRRQDLVDRLVAALEDRMFELADEEGDAIDDGSLSGRAHWLLPDDAGRLDRTGPDRPYGGGICGATRLQRTHFAGAA